MVLMLIAAEVFSVVDLPFMASAGWKKYSIKQSEWCNGEDKYVQQKHDYSVSCPI